MNRDIDNLDISEQIKNHKALYPEEIDAIYNDKRFVEVLIRDYCKYGNIVIAYDFDDTVRPLNSEATCQHTIELLQVCSKLGFGMMCYTARCNPVEIEWIKRILKELDIRFDTINETHPTLTKFQHQEGDLPSKIFFNILLDDRAGLGQAYRILWGFIDWYLNNR